MAKVDSIVGREAFRARLHQPTHATNVGNIGPSLDENAGKVLGSSKLYKVEGGLLFICKGTEVFIPDANIISMELKPEAPSKK